MLRRNELNLKNQLNLSITSLTQDPPQDIELMAHLEKCHSALQEVKQTPEVELDSHS